MPVLERENTEDRLSMTVTLRLSREDVTKLERLAKALDRSPASTLRRLLRTAAPAGAELVFHPN